MRTPMLTLMKPLAIIGAIAGTALPALMVTTPAWAQTVAAGKQVEVTVEYEYVSNNKREDKYDLQQWEVRRLAMVALTLQAQKPTEFPTLHKQEEAQKKDVAERQAAMERAHGKMQPTMNDMMAIANKCGEDEACIEREVKAYAGQNSGALNQTRRNVAGDAAIVSRQGKARYQTWLPVGAQRGRFEVAEQIRMVDADPICRKLADKRCRTDTSRIGSGPIPLPPGAKASANHPVGSATFETDSGAKDMIIMLPFPLMPLTVTQNIRTDHPQGKNGDTKRVFRFPPAGVMDAYTPMTVPLKGNGVEQSGTLTIPVKGAQKNPRTLEGSAPEDGTLTVRWRVKPI